MIYISASDLVKKSMAQMVYLHLTKTTNKPTPAQINGDLYASNFIGTETKEKRGMIRHKDFIIFFCIDMVVADVAVEIKSTQFDIKEWYFNQSIVQSSLYAYFITLVKKLDTPKFMVNKGAKYEVIDLYTDPIRYYTLKFGDSIYLIEKSIHVMYFYLRKAVFFKNCIELDFTQAITKAKEWDNEYKFKDHIDLITKIKYKKLNGRTREEKNNQENTLIPRI